MAKPIRISILANASQAQREVSSFSSSLKRAFGVGAALVGTAGLVQGFKSVSGAASDAQQSLGATESIFKQYADTVVKESERAATKYGLSANEYRENSNLLGALFKGQGVELDKLAGKTDDMIGIAADLSAQFGGSSKEAVEALSSAFKGETDPIERYGISIKQSDVNARLAAKGQDQLTGAARKQAEQIARTELIVAGAADAQGAFAREADTAEGSQQRLTAQWKDAQAQLGQRLLPAITDVTQWFSGKLPGALDATEDAFDAVGNVVEPVVDLLQAVPGPVKEIGIQAGIAALVLPRLTGAVTGAAGGLATFSARLRQTHAEMTYATTRAQRLQTVTAGLGSAARTTAGIGGMVALAQGAQQSNDALSTLTYTAGGAATGFAVGGPLGAAIGGTAGLMYGLYDSTKDAADETRRVPDSVDYAKVALDGYRDTLDQTTGAIQRMTRARVLDNIEASGVLSTSQALGIETRDLIGAILGNEGAIRRVSKGWSDQDSVIGNLVQRNKLKDWLEDQGIALQQDQAAVKKRTEDLKGWAQALKGVPKAVRTELRQDGYKPSIRDLRALERQYDLTPKQVKTIIAATGVRATVSDVKGVQKAVKDLDRTPVKMDPLLRGLSRGMGSAKTTARKGKTDVNNELGKFGDVDLSPEALTRELTGIIGSAAKSGRTSASSAGSGVGSALGLGMASGISSQKGAIAAAAASAVDYASRSASARAEIHSPSRLMARIGKQMGLGMAVGMREARPQINKTGKDSVDWLTQGLAQGAPGVRRNFSKIIAQIGKTFEKTTERDFTPRLERSWNKWLTDATKQLGAKANAYSRQLNRVARQQQRVVDLIQQRNAYAASIRSSVVSAGAFTQFGQNEDGTVAIGNLIDQMRDQAQESKRFQVLVRQLTRQGLNRTSIQQLLDAGVEGGLETAEALASGGKAAIKEVNSLQGQISSAGKTLGIQTSRTMYQAGIQTAQGMLRGMQSQEKRLENQATRMARRIAQAVRKALKISSPSKVFEGIGAQVTDGLVIGLDDYRAAKAGTVLAGSLVDGFARPQLRADYDPSSDPRRNRAVTVRLTADQVSALQRGREIQADLDLYQAAGGRRRAS